MEDKDKIIEELKQEIESLRGKVGALQSFGSAAICKSCKKWYPVGYICHCGRDNSYSNKEWAEAKVAKHRLHQTGGRGSKKSKLVVPAAGKA